LRAVDYALRQHRSNFHYHDLLAPMITTADRPADSPGATNTRSIHRSADFFHRNFLNPFNPFAPSTPAAQK